MCVLQANHRNLSTLEAPMKIVFKVNSEIVWRGERVMRCCKLFRITVISRLEGLRLSFAIVRLSVTFIVRCLLLEFRGPWHLRWHFVLGKFKSGVQEDEDRGWRGLYMEFRKSDWRWCTSDTVLVWEFRLYDSVSNRSVDMIGSLLFKNLEVSKYVSPSIRLTTISSVSTLQESPPILLLINSVKPHLTRHTRSVRHYRQTLVNVIKHCMEP